MIRNYMKAAFRNLLRESGNTVINVAGLTLGITGTFVLFLIVWNGINYDTYHSRYDRIYRVVSKEKGNMGDSFTQGIPPVLPEAFESDIHEAEEVAITAYRRNNLIAVPQPDGSVKKYEEPAGVVFTQPSFFRIFDRKLMSGFSDKALDEPNEAIISVKWALKYFGKEDGAGRSIVFDNIEYKITAVMEDFPPNTDFPFDLMLSYITIKRQMDHAGWGSVSDTDNCYFLLNENESITKVESQLPGFVKKHRGDDHDKRTFLIQPLKEVHRDMRFGNYNKRMPVAAQIAFTAIAAFLLLTACINFVNLSTAQAIKRTREVGIRKVLGSSRSQLIFQVLNEAFLTTLTAMIFSLALVPGALTFINPFLDLSLSLNFNDPIIWVAIVGLTIVITALAGIYPALRISAFNAALALKNQIGVKAASSYTMRRGLVVLQFFISQLFIFGTLFMTKQMAFMQNLDIGFAKEAIITVPIPVHEQSKSDSTGKMRMLKNELLRLSGVLQASLNHSQPASNRVMSTGFSIAGKDDEITTQMKPVDGDYIDLFDLEIIAGQPLADLDTLNGLVVNEKLAIMAGFQNADDIVGQEMMLWGKRLPVKGVVKDFHTRSLEHPMEPVMLYNDKGAYISLSLKLAPANMQATISQVKAQWEATYPEYLFKYDFMDEQIENLYNGERKTAVMLNVFSAIVIFIGCLGLFGLVTYMANQRTKEVGIRKVLGASVVSIMFLFSKEFAKLIVIGFVLSAPIAGFLMHMMLQEFAYKIELGPGIFLTGLSATFAIAFVTVGYRSLIASTANPVQALRSE
jgi:putative ABC transport system permease protein